jgi:hypothetical protein
MVARALEFPFGRQLVMAGRLRRQRELPPDARPLVSIGESVRADQPLAEVARPGGTLSLLAGLAGTVRDIGQSFVVVEGVATILQGMAGLGGAVVGPLYLVPTSESPAMVAIQPGAILVYPRSLPLTLLQHAAAGGAAGIIAASASALELEAFVRTDLSALFDGLLGESLRAPLTIVLTDGFGEHAMSPAIHALLATRAGSMALLSGMTRPREGIRPDVLLPAPPTTQPATLPLDTTLIVGAKVRVASGQYQGADGEIVSLFSHPQPVETGQLLPAATVRLDQGGAATVPLAQLDRLA